jgi:aminobenzoyl-glutamate utilization protein A
MTGVIGILRCGEGPTVAMRFDIDALGVFEEKDKSHRPSCEGFSSVNTGFMHACGHDGHATIGLGVAEILMAIRSSLHGTIKLIFQPAEEGVRGAKSIVENGHLDGVDYLLASHVSPKEDGDPAVVIPGSYGSLATTKMDVIFRGVSAHAAGAPEIGKNVMMAVGTSILNLYAIPRHSGGESRVNVGTVVAGSGRNVIADEAKMEIEVRGETTEINQFMEDYARSIVENAAKMHGCTCEIKLMGAAYSLESDPELEERVKKVVEDKLHMPVSEEMHKKSGGSEDVSYMMKRVQDQGGQATFMLMLTKEAAPGHNRRFDFDEQALPNAVKIFCGMVFDILGE